MLHCRTPYRTDMSTGPTMSPDTHSTPSEEIPQPTDAYRKAHKSYVLVSGLLASWELIGVIVDTKGRWGIELKSPKAVPLILFTLVFYSGYKMTVEWLQCVPARRKETIARVDFWVAHFIAFTAILIGVVQFLARIQIVDWLNRHVPPREPPKISIDGLLFVGMFAGIMFSVGAIRLWKGLGWGRRSIVLLPIPLAIYCTWRFLVLESGFRLYLGMLTAIVLGPWWPLILTNPPWLRAFEARIGKRLPRFLKKPDRS